jgi:hypothetical protein
MARFHPDARLNTCIRRSGILDRGQGLQERTHTVQDITEEFSHRETEGRRESLLCRRADITTSLEKLRELQFLDLIF